MKDKLKLYIDTSDNKKTIVGLNNKIVEKESGKDKSQQVLKLINEILVENGKIISDLTEIEVNIGPGSYTGLKVGTAVANAIAWALNIPVNGQKLVFPKYE